LEPPVWPRVGSVDEVVFEFDPPREPETIEPRLERMPPPEPVVESWVPVAPDE
jgi:hypothetical protein